MVLAQLLMPVTLGALSCHPPSVPPASVSPSRGRDPVSAAGTMSSRMGDLCWTEHGTLECCVVWGCCGSFGLDDSGGSFAPLGGVEGTRISCSFSDSPPAPVGKFPQAQAGVIFALSVALPTLPWEVVLQTQVNLSVNSIHELALPLG